MTAAGAARHTSGRKASRMTQYTAARPAGRPGIAGLARLAGRTLSNRIHATADQRARARGWHITETPGPLGLRGRRYRDPRFTALRSCQDTAPTTGRAS